jgi:serine acetyltransferase
MSSSPSCCDDGIVFHDVAVGHAKLGPLRMRNDMTVEANAVVTFDVPDGATVVSQKASIIHPAAVSK